MNYLKFTPYAYLLAGLLFAFDAFQKYAAGDKNNAYISGGFAAVGIFMFFFRRNYAKKFQERNKQP